MKKLFVILTLFCSLKSVAQTTDSLLALHAIIVPYTHITPPYTANKYFTGFNTYGSLPDSVRTFFSATSPILYNNSTGVISSQAATTSLNGYLTSTDWNTFNGKQAALSGTGYSKWSATTPSYVALIPIADGGTNNGSLSVTNGNLLYTDGSKVVGLGIGTAGQHLLGGTIPHWGDTTAAAGAGGGAGDSTYFWNKLNGNIGSHTDTTNLYLGTNGLYALRLKTNGVTRMLIDSVGNFGLNGVIQAGMRATIYGPAQIAGNGGTASDALLNLNPSVTGSLFDIISKSVTSGSGSTVLPTGYLVLKPTTTGTYNVGIHTNGSLNVGWLGDPIGMINVTTTGAGNPNIYLTQFGINRIKLSSNTTSGDFTVEDDGTAWLRMFNASKNIAVGTSTDVPSALFQVSSTTKGFLPPRMTTTQRNAMTSGIATGTRVAGSGYTNGTYVANSLTGGTGSGATATIVVSGGTVTSVAIVSVGQLYVVGDVLSTSGIGGGTGFSFTVATLNTTAEGMIVYDLTTHKSYTWDATAWQAHF